MNVSPIFSSVFGLYQVLWLFNCQILHFFHQLLFGSEQLVYSGFLELVQQLPPVSENDTVRAVRVNQNKKVACQTAKQ